jgi:DNA-binding response OmpR family regulator
VTEPLTILIYHPNRILLNRLIQFVQAAGYATLSASNETEAVQLVREMRPEIFLVAPLLAADLTVAEEVQTRYSSTRLIVLAETDAIVERAQAMGIDEVVLYDESDIGNVLEALINSSATSEVSIPASEGIGVLIVDDEPDAVDMLSLYLTQCGYRALGAADGREALQILKRDTDVRVVLLDINLPDMGGMQVLREITVLRSPPSVIMLTAIRDSVIAKHALRIGARDYLLKPIDLKALDEAIKMCLARQEYRERHWWKRQRDA